MFSTTALPILASLTLALPALANSAIFTESDAIGTFYYDVSEVSSQAEACGSTAGDPVVADWAISSGINGGVPYCEKSRGRTLSELGTNAIVAFNNELVAADPAKWCGREVNIYDADGNLFEFEGGQLFIWDGCAACGDTNSQKIDLSAPAFAQLKGGTCSGTNPSGLKYEVLDTYFWDPSVGLGSAYSAESGSVASSTDSGSQSTSGQADTSAATSTSSSTAAVQSSTEVAVSVGLSAGLSISVTSQPTRTIRYSSTLSTQTVTQNNKDKVLAVVDSATYSSSESATSTQEETSASPTTSVYDDSTSATTTTDDDSATATTTTDASSASSAAASTSGASGCTYGAWQCSGLTLQVCNYQSLSELDWETIETCTSVCDVTSSGSIDCE